MRIKDFKRRDDLCSKGQTRVMHAPNIGYIIKAKKGWYATIDERLGLVGTVDNGELEQPTVGPYKSAQEVMEVFDRKLTKQA